ncbi:MAG TPA: DUF1501 domain-containing protein [Pirellulaceae bacterium]|nr:DUF1501 domain-containing protein [Pirellulaceae bacterium]
MTTRRQFLQHCQLGIGAAALSSLWSPQRAGQQVAQSSGGNFGRARNVIYIHLAGSPSQLELFEYKPELKKRNMQACPQELLAGEKFAFIQGTPNLLGPTCGFEQNAKTGSWFSELIPNIAAIADELTIVRSMTTDQFNHAPAQLYLLTGNSISGYPSLGSWVTYGLGSENENLPGFVVLLSGGNNPSGGKALWGSGFLPGEYQGVQCRTSGDPILFLKDPPGMDQASRRSSIDAINALNTRQLEQHQDPETLARIRQYELAYRMQIEAPFVMDISAEPAAVLESYGAVPGANSLANNCLLARRLVEKGVRFVQLFDYGWDVHGTGSFDDLLTQFPKKCAEMDRPFAALIADLKARGMLDETLVVWGGEFGRTAMNEARGGSKFLGRDHHPHAFTMLFAGAGMKPGLDFGLTDDFGYRVIENQVSVRDIQATILHTLGLDPTRHSYAFQGLNHRLIGPTEEAKIRFELLA